MGEAMSHGTDNPATSAMSVQVCYLSPEDQLIQDVAVPIGATIRQALEIAGLSGCFAEAVQQGYIGIYGQKMPVDAVLKPDDRIEIYRPLRDLPQNIRRRRVEQMRSQTYTKWDKDVHR